MIEKFKNKKIERFFNSYILILASEERVNEYSHSHRPNEDKIFTNIFLYSYFLMFPVVSFAFPVNLTDAVNHIFFPTFNIIVPILTTLAFLVFFWGVAKFILASGNEKDLKDGRQFMIWGILALFILISVWGIVQFMSDQFGFGAIQNTTHILPE